MKHHAILRHEFVEFIPKELPEGVIYVSIPYAMAIHNCPCGCGSRVVTPLSPADWTLIFDGRSISLDPSIGNWSFPCRSHYWIRNNKIVWSRKFSEGEIERVREKDDRDSSDYFGAEHKDETKSLQSGTKGRKMNKRSLKGWLRNFFGAEHSD